jgi:hypothetical protein
MVVMAIAPPTMIAEIGTSNPPKLTIESTNLTRGLLHVISGGADRDRTGGLLVANQALSQLSYSPILAFSRQLSVRTESCELMADSWFWWAWIDLNYRPHPYQGCALAT